jgi:hypothetical protein
VGLIHALIHRSAWNRNSANFAANFAFIEFCELRLLGILGSSHSKNSRKLAVSKKALDTWATVATMCTYEADNPKCRGFEARLNYGRLRDGQSQWRNRLPPKQEEMVGFVFASGPKGREVMRKHC